MPGSPHRLKASGSGPIPAPRSGTSGPENAFLADPGALLCFNRDIGESMMIASGSRCRIASTRVNKYTHV